MKPPILFITGTDTGVGKTVVATLLARYWRARGLRVAALKPVCSGGRDDARALWNAADRALSLDQVNPWHFRAPLAPLLAARRQRRRVRLSAVLQHIRAASRGFDLAVVEGAGGLLSPLGEGFDSRELIVALQARPIVVAANQLGVLNHVRLALEALPAPARRQAQVVLMQTQQPDNSATSNAKLLSEFVPSKRLHVWPWFRAPLIVAWDAPAVERLAAAAVTR